MSRLQQISISTLLILHGLVMAADDPLAHLRAHLSVHPDWRLEVETFLKPESPPVSIRLQTGASGRFRLELPEVLRVSDGTTQWTLGAGQLVIDGARGEAALLTQELLRQLNAPVLTTLRRGDTLEVHQSAIDHGSPVTLLFVGDRLREVRRTGSEEFSVLRFRRLEPLDAPLPEAVFSRPVLPPGTEIVDLR